MPNRAPIVIAQRNLSQSRAAFKGQINDAVLLAVNRYWDVVLQRDNLEVVKKSLAEAEASYKQSKRALELGAVEGLLFAFDFAEQVFLGPVRQVGFPIRLSRTPARIESAGPALGEQTDEVLKSIGYDDARIEALRSQGVV